MYCSVIFKAEIMRTCLVQMRMMTVVYYAVSPGLMLLMLNVVVHELIFEGLISSVMAMLCHIIYLNKRIK